MNDLGFEEVEMEDESDLDERFIQAME